MTINAPIGILGGTFDPVHNGHLHLATSVLHECQCQQVRLMPCLQSPHREAPHASSVHRVAMLAIAIKGHNGLAIDDTELLRPAPSYMFDTLKILNQQKDEHTPLCLIVGLDAFTQFDRWLRWQEIFDLAHLIIAERPHTQANYSEALLGQVEQRRTDSVKKLRSQTTGLIYFHPTPMLELSASQIRLRIAKSDYPEDSLPTGVLDYIREQDLYKS